jgi:hypothetical protein
MLTLLAVSASHYAGLLKKPGEMVSSLLDFGNSCSFNVVAGILSFSGERHGFDLSGAYPVLPL